LADTLLIVESPAKARAIQKYLGKGYSVRASMGHVRDLPTNDLAVKIEQDFQPTFVIPKEKRSVVAELKKAADRSDGIVLAADPDREGEAICYHIAEVLKEAGKPIRRVLFHEVTPAAVRAAVESPVEVDPHKVNAQIARRIIDRLVGYQISPLLWDKVKKGLSAGRVQTVALRMIREREAEILAFRSEEYWVVSALLKGEAEKAFEAKLTHVQGKKTKIRSGEENEALRASLEGNPWSVLAVEKKRQKRSPPPPFTTSKLQQEAARLLKYPVKKTMGIAQRLYEGLDLAGGETVGLITYMRTDSTRLSPGAVDAARDYIQQAFGKDHLPGKPRLYAPKKAAQDAHEAIRPTDVGRTPEAMKAFLKPEELALYRLIWKRFVACQMASALFDNTRAQITCGDAVFLAQGSVCVFQGFRAVYQSEGDEEQGGLPALAEGEALDLLELRSEQKFTEPPPRYSEGTLVKALEENGIGRPSTYSSIISTIQERGYVLKNGGALTPTDLGILVCDLLVEQFPGLFNVGYTAGMELELDKVESGEEERLQLLKRFWSQLSGVLEDARRSMANLRRDGKATDEICEKCGKPMVLKVGRYGSFLACTGYPECKSTRPAGDEEPLEVPPGAGACEKCGSALTVRKGRYGPFLACERYPECRFTLKLRKAPDGGYTVLRDEVLQEACPECGANLVKKQGRYGPFTACGNYPKCSFVKRDIIDTPCPKCGKALVRRKSKRGKTFYGCTGYPKCDFIAWDLPVKGTCPECKSPYLVEKIRRGGKTVVACPRKGCKYERS